MSEGKTVGAGFGHRFERGFQEATIGMALSTDESIFLRVNATLCELLGRSEDELVGNSSLDLTHPDDIELTVAGRSDALRNGSAVRTKRFIRPDGSVIEARVSGTVVEEGDARYIFWQVEDDTERLRSERQKEAIADLGRLAVRTTDLSLLMAEAANAARERLGADTGVLWKPTADGSAFEPEAASPGGVEVDAPVPMGGSLLGATLERNEPIVSNDLAAERRFRVYTGGDPDIRRAITVPVPDSGGSGMVLAVVNDGSGRDFLPDDVRFLEAVAHVLAGALDRAAYEARFRAIFEHSAEGIALWDDDRRFLEANGALEEVFGVEQGGLVGRETGEFARSSTPEHVEAAWRELFEQGRQHGRLAIRRPDGAVRMVEYSAVANVLPGQHLSVMRDVTDQVAAEDALREATERFSAAFRYAPIGMALVAMEGDEAGRPLAVNDSFCQTFGYTEDELLATDPASLSHPDDLFIGQPETERLLAGEVPSYSVEKRMVRKDGAIIWARLQVSLVRSRVTNRHAVLELEDVTAGKLAADALKQSEARSRGLAAIVDSSDDAIMALDLEQRVVAWNGGAERTFGHPAEAVLGQPAQALAGNREGGDETWEMVAAARAGRSSHGQVERVMKDGRRVHLAITASPIRDASDEIVGTAIIARDTTAEVKSATEREQLQQHLNEIQRLESIGELAGGIAHDFNNLLSVILSYASFALDHLEGHPAHSEVEEMRLAAQRAAALTRQLLTFSRREVVHPEVFQPNGLLAELEHLLDRTSGERIELRVHRDEDAPRIRCDRSQLEQIVMNLAINARDAMPSGGVLTIATSREQRPEGPCMCLSVSDTGEGMEPEVRAQIFEPFFTTKPAGRGTGLGLATVYGIVRRARARIEVDSTVGKGSVFRVLFPAVKSGREHTAPPPGVSFSERSGNARILIVEDERQVAAVANRILSARGYSPIVAGSAEDALGLLDGEAAGIDLVLTDLVMPEMPGSLLADAIHARRPDLRVVFMSGYTDRPDSLPPGAFFLVKPFTSAALLAVVEDALVGDGPDGGG